MDHLVATESGAVERYLLGELAPKEREEFEEHMADCQRCLDDAWTGEIFAANAQAVFRERAAGTVVAPRKSWLDFLRWRPMPALAFSGALNLALVAIVAVGVLRVVPHLESNLQEANQAGNGMDVFVPGPARGLSEPVMVSKSMGFVTLNFDLSRQFSRYACAIERIDRPASGSCQINIQPDVSMQHLIVPVAGREPGDYRVTIKGSDGAKSQELLNVALHVVDAK
jgi:hypothetical protein